MQIFYEIWGLMFIKNFLDELLVKVRLSKLIATRLTCDVLC